MPEFTQGDNVSQLRAEVEVLKARLEHLAGRVPDASGTGDETRPAAMRRTGRRDLLKVAGVAVLGAVGASMLDATPAEATTGTMMFGQGNDAGTDHTDLMSSSSGGTLVITNSGSGPGMFVGTTGAGDSLSGGDNGTGTGGGVAAVLGNPANSSIAISGVTAGTGSAVIGKINNSSNSSPAVLAQGSDSGYGVSATGGRAPLLLVPAASPGAPTTGSHVVGELYVDSNGVFFGCVAAGTPGTWRSLVEQFIPVNPPGRAYDSRTGGGRLDAGVSRNVSLTPGGFPAGARAVLVNLTIINTVGSGYLTVYQQGATKPPTSNINWYQSGQTTANNATPSVSAAGDVSVFCGGSGGTDFVIDVFGYYP